jgi:osmotically inducible lipoprotein OsmB
MEASEMNTIRKLTVMATISTLLLGMGGCTVIGAGVGAAAGSGTSVGMVGGAVIGGVVGYSL